jgi:hypothetical protein
MVIASPAEAGEAISRDHSTCNDRLIMGVGKTPPLFFIQIVLVNGFNDGSI